MKARILKLSPGTEIAVVLATAFGIFMPGNIAVLVSPELIAHRAAPPISNSHLQGLILYELVVLGILAAFLHARGWTLGRLGIRPTIRDSAWGVGISVGYTAAYWLLVILLATLWPAFAGILTSTHLVSADLQWPTVLLSSAVNPVFEEVFVCGYVIAALKDRFGLTAAVNVSAALRVSYHFYQGAVGVVGIAPLALLFAYWFGRTGRLWPLIVAHAIMDFCGLAASI